MTFSIIARCERTGQLGAAISSSSPAVASRCIRAKAGVGVVASQNITDPNLSQILIEMMQYNLAPIDAGHELVKSTEFIQYRQLMALSATDVPFVFSGEHTLGTFATAQGKRAACAGNMLSSTAVPEKMLMTFEQSEGSLASRLLESLVSGYHAGGEEGDVHSAGLLVVDKATWPIVDLRVDWSDTPIEDLQQLWDIYEPQLDDYIVRALNPTISPSYGVPGDL
ncbi:MULTISPECIES: DUF1028 domain-containing protein [Psychrobacter]|jgi:uncharacterized Ntn-hydrolase superfamily protein|uniref:DUF1028 domain-containing protein n=1 Tax=Psychrobacter TaxID=497 RepID=UPI0007F55486|nr:MULTISPECIES: DUF1028 domain-containing protein [Psychrobacter]MDN5620899.1 DUF1028 domain-containing protein [Psychrobacter sp.]OAP69411.1 fimbrial assembly protein FimA [Psychrobacter sp. SHUES1]HCT73892.1 DUF1028 domain-containing protein [Psychrobacter sp.]